jgi:hypothetical protein
MKRYCFDLIDESNLFVPVLKLETRAATAAAGAASCDLVLT